MSYCRACSRDASFRSTRVTYVTYVTYELLQDMFPRCILPLDAQTAYLQFPQFSRFLGVDSIFDLCDSAQTERGS